MKNAISNHAGMPQSNTFLKPGLYIASIRTTARKIQTMGKLLFPSIADAYCAVQNGVAEW